MSNRRWIMFCVVCGLAVSSAKLRLGVWVTGNDNFQNLTTCVVIKAGFGDVSAMDDESSTDYESTSMCKTRKHRINPDELIDPHGAWKFDENFKQVIEVELCENEGSPCTDTPLLMKTKCKQKHLSIQLQVVAKNQTRSLLKTFSIPSNCQCVYYRNWLVRTEWNNFKLFNK